jgi:hypothetical protein
MNTARQTIAYRMKMTVGEAVGLNEPRLGWFTHAKTKDSDAPAASLLQDTGEHLKLTIPMDKESTFNSSCRWFDGDGVSFGDDPDKTKYEYEPPEAFLFSDPRGTVGLFHCRSMGKQSQFIGPSEGVVRVGFAVPGARSLSYGLPNRLRTYIPGMGRWIGMTSLETRTESDDSGLLSGVSAKTTKSEEIVLDDHTVIDTSWQAVSNRGNNEFKLTAPPFIESHFEEGADFYDHLNKHQKFQDLVALAYWRPTGYSRIQCSRTDEITPGRNWLDVETYLVKSQNEDHGTDVPLFRFPDIGVEGYRKWVDVCSKYERSIFPMLSLLRMEGAPIETRFIQSCVALDSLGVEMAKDEGVTGMEPFFVRMDRIVDKLGFSFSDDWGKRTAKHYNGIKHYDKGLDVDPLDAYYNMLENELIFRAWAALEIGLTRDYVFSAMETTPAGQALVGKPGVRFPKPSESCEDRIDVDPQS